jgi:glutamate dehydrogenase (NAD(P)+)
MVQAIEGASGQELFETERKQLIRGPNEEDLVNSGLEETMSAAFHDIRGAQTSNPKIPVLRTAAFVRAIEKIAQSYLELGVFP